MDEAIASCRAIPSGAGGVELDIAAVFSRSGSLSAVGGRAVASCRLTRSVAGGVSSIRRFSRSQPVVDKAVTVRAGADELDTAVVSRTGSLSAGGLDEAIASCRAIPSGADEVELDIAAVFPERDRSQPVGG